MGDFLAESAEFKVPNWALLVGGAYALHKLHTGKVVPVRQNPIGLTFGAVIGVAALALGTKAILNVGDIFSGSSAVGLGLGLGLGGLYAMKKGEKVLGPALAGAFAGWGLGFAYEASQEGPQEDGLITKTFNWVI